MSQESLINPSMRNGMCLISTVEIIEKCKHNISLFQVSTQNDIKTRWILAFI